jgi:hypothetical protein
VIERRFHRNLYPAAALSGAMKVYERFARFEVADEGDHQVVRITAKKPERERLIALELGNYALGLTRKEALS